MQYNLSLCLISLFVFLVSIFVAKPQITYRNLQRNNVRKGITAFFLLLIINSVFAFWSEDTYHSWQGFAEANRYLYFELGGYEEVYNWLATAVGNNYFLWRACIWIPACLFMYWTAKRLDLLNRNFLVAMLLFGSFLAYTRGMLGHTMLVLGAVLFLDKKSGNLMKILGLALVCVSYFFHKSMYVNIIFAVLALFSFGKKTVTISLIAFPFLTTVVTYLVDGISSGRIEMALGESVGGVGDRTLLYVSGEQMVSNAFGVIGKFIQCIPQYLTIFYLYNKVMVVKIFGGVLMFINICSGLHTLHFTLPRCFCSLKRRLGYMNDLSTWGSFLWCSFWEQCGAGRDAWVNGRGQSYCCRHSQSSFLE